MAPTLASTLTNEQLQELLSLIKGADTVELKVTVPDVRTTVRALGLDPLDAQIRQVFFLDTPDLVLDNHGVVVRARRTQKRPDDSVVKLRPVVPSELPKDIRKSASFGVEVDASPSGFVCSGSMKGRPSADVRSVMLGKGKIRDLFSKEQQVLYKRHAPEGLELDDLSILGPIFVLKLKATVDGYEHRKLVGEMWLYPDGSRILELSTKCMPSEAFQVAAESRAFLGAKGIDLAGEQAMKTRTALEFFAAEMAGPKPAPARTRSRRPAASKAAGANGDATA
jgi:hypothetical protein